jgi:hypothetical protein
MCCCDGFGRFIVGAAVFRIHDILAGLRIRIWIRIRINLSCWIRIRIQIAHPDPDPGGQNDPQK